MVDFCYLTGHPENLPSCFPDWYEDSNDGLLAESSPPKSCVWDPDPTLMHDALNTKIENDKNKANANAWNYRLDRIDRNNRTENIPIVPTEGRRDKLQKI